LGQKALHSAANNGWLAENALVVLEEASDTIVELDAAFKELDTRKFGDTIIRLYRWS
jgi:16S rRNA G966 N2-methylase RsmD